MMIQLREEAAVMVDGLKSASDAATSQHKQDLQKMQALMGLAVARNDVSILQGAYANCKLRFSSHYKTVALVGFSYEFCLAHTWFCSRLQAASISIVQHWPSISLTQHAAPAIKKKSTCCRPHIPCCICLLQACLAAFIT